MSSTPQEFELDLDLQLLPAWARQPATENRYSRFEGESEEGRHGERFGRRERRGGPGDRFGRRDRPGGPRPPGGGPGPRTDRGERPRPPGPRGEPRREEPIEPPEAPLEIEVRFTPEAAGVEALARHVRLTGRAYPLFDIASFILKRADRYQTALEVKRDAEGKILQPLVVCSLDESVWLDESEVLAHVLAHHFGTFYQVDKVATEPPKGTYTLVAQCGMSGVVLGPPNYHDYQTKLRKLHAERFSRMPFDVYKSRIKMVRDEAVVKKWIDEQSWKEEYVCLNVPESLKLSTRADVERHFREIHLPNLLRTVESCTLPASGKRPFLSPRLLSAIRRSQEEQRRFPLRLATTLSQQLANHGLQFFKVNRTITHVCVARPHYLDLTTVVVSDGVRRIVEFIDTHPRCTRRHLLERLAPAPAPATPAASPPVASPPPPPSAAPTETAEPATPTETAPPAEPAAAPTPAPAAAPETPLPTPEQAMVIADLHWLVHQGHVIEFSDGHMELARQPKPKPPTPPRPEPKRAPAETTPAPAGAPTPVPPPVSASGPAPAAPTDAAQPTPDNPDLTPVPAPPTPTPTPPESPAAEPAAEPTAAVAAPQPPPATEPLPSPAPAPSPSPSEPKTPDAA